MSNSALVFALAALKKASTANERIDNLPLPMVFKGTLGTGGTIETLPTASIDNVGYVYIVITDGTYSGQTAKVGDLFISDGTLWVLVPSADEPTIKSFTYTGTGTNPNVITFSEIPTHILSIEGYSAADESSWSIMQGFIWGVTQATMYVQIPASLGSPALRSIGLSYNNKELTLTGGSSTQVCNTNNIVYTVYYI